MDSRIHGNDDFGAGEVIPANAGIHWHGRARVRPEDAAPVTRARHVTIVGAGIVGVCCARFLQRAGFEISVVDRGEPGKGTSFGNLGMLCSLDHTLPLASMAVLATVPRMLLDFDSPLAIRGRYLPRLVPWLVRFAANAPEATRMRNARALASLLEDTLAAYKRLTDGSPAAQYVRHSGSLTVYASARRFERAAAERARLRSLGTRVEELGGDEIRQLEPTLHPRYRYATWFPDCGHTPDPFLLTRAIADEVRAAGGDFVEAKVRGFDIGPDGVRALRTEGAPIPVERLVVAAGAWSKTLARDLGSRVPLEAERGYHSMLRGVDTGLRRPITNGEEGLGLTQMVEGLRIGGTVEFASLHAAPDYARTRAFHRKAREMLPDLPPESDCEVSRWMGFRPSLPDHLPVIGPSPHHRNVWFAFGHQHLGLSLGARTGEVIAALIAGENPRIDLHPYRIDRFRPWTH